MSASDYPTAPLYRCPGKRTLLRFKNTGEYEPLALGDLRRVMRIHGFANLSVDERGRVLSPSEIVRIHAVLIDEAEYARLEAYRQRLSTWPPAPRA